MPDILEHLGSGIWVGSGLRHPKESVRVAITWSSPVWSLLNPHIWPKKRWVCSALHFFQKYETADYEPAIFGEGIQKSHGFIIFSDAAAIFQKVSCVYRNVNRISTPYFPVACCAWDGCKLQRKRAREEINSCEDCSCCKGEERQDPTKIRNIQCNDEAETIMRCQNFRRSENSGDVIYVDDDSAFSANRNNAEDSDSYDVEG